MFLPRGINTNCDESKANISQTEGHLRVTDTESPYTVWHGENNCQSPRFTPLQV